MGTFYVDDFDVNRCNDSKTSDLHGVVLHRSRTYSRRAIYRRRAGKGVVTPGIRRMHGLTIAILFAR